MASTEGFAAVFYSEPGVLGLLGNVVSAFLLCLQNFTLAATGLGPRAAEQVLAGECCCSGWGGGAGHPLSSLRVMPMG